MADGVEEAEAILEMMKQAGPGDILPVSGRALQNLQHRHIIGNPLAHGFECIPTAQGGWLVAPSPVMGGGTGQLREALACFTTPEEMIAWLQSGLAPAAASPDTKEPSDD